MKTKLFNIADQSCATASRRAALLTCALGALTLAAPHAAHGQQVALEGLVIEGASVILEPTDAATLGNSVTVVTGEQIAERQVRTVGEALQTVPGVQVARSGTTGSLTEVRIRGAEANHALVLIDGIEANNVTTGVIDLSDLLAEDIERIEVIRGAQSGIWGSNALAGVINIVTRGGKGPFRARASVEGGTLSTRQLAASASGGGDYGYLSLGIVDRTTAGFNIAQTGDEKDGSDQRNIRFKAGLTPAKWLSIDGVLIKVDKEADFDGSGSVNGFSVPVDGRDRLSVSDNLLGRGSAKLSFFDDRWITKVYGEQARIDLDTTTPGFDSFIGSIRKRYGVVSSVTFDTPQFAAAKHTFEALYDHEEETFELETTFSPFAAYERDLDSVAGEYRGAYFDQVYLRAAVRNDDSSAFGSFTTWSVSGAWKIPGTGTRLHASYGTGVVFPNMFEQFGQAPGFFTPNPDLLPEESKGFDVGVEQSLFDGIVVFDVTYFDQNLENEIRGPFTGPPRNLEGETERRGIEIAARYAPTSYFDLSATYTYLDIDSEEFLASIRRPEHSGSVNAAYRFDEGRGLFNIGLIYNGSTTDVGVETAGFTQLPVPLDSYTVLNIAAHYDLTDEVRLFGRVENVLDEAYQEVFGYSSPPIEAFAGVRVKLGAD